MYKARIIAMPETLKAGETANQVEIHPPEHGHRSAPFYLESTAGEKSYKYCLRIMGNGQLQVQDISGE